MFRQVAGWLGDPYKLRPDAVFANFSGCALKTNLDACTVLRLHAVTVQCIGWDYIDREEILLLQQHNEHSEEGAKDKGEKIKSELKVLYNNQKAVQRIENFPEKKRIFSDISDVLENWNR